MRRSRRPLTPLARLGGGRWEDQRPTWREARPALIASALKRAQSRPSGNWYVAAAGSEVGSGRITGRTVAGIELVLWRDSAGAVHAAPGACPHLGAPLCESGLREGTIVCHWHGLALEPGGVPGWDPYPAHDDGLLVWVRLDAPGGETPTPAPFVPERPASEASLAAVMTVVGRCEPEDVVANRLDPWHGAWFHPHAFADLTVRQAPATAEDAQNAAADRFLVDVAFRVRGRLGVPVRAEFTAPGPRTVVMRIVSGEGTGSVVETHATPLGTGADGRPRTAVIEAVVAHSRRPGFAAARHAAPLLRPLVRRTAARLWRDDLAYAERRYDLRSQGRFPG
ncbi:DUF5914 domain-containing protein [Streptomyces sp. NPDC088354]|uniref:DUF5914 domain-containing protein n=1 Tax=unclassified Streptomyces TaxID=2593676 RepID=UPI0029BBCBEE|nr:DUF5914 domain-containing protein [Streptomyces sp. MI02-7b]MDX3075437.1 DUF5914 domain-containing protein [Streptomyces sp. MI02-7b]